MMQKIVIVGGGAAGMLAAFSAANNGKSVTLIEKNEKLGKKLYITGKGRCNVTANVNVPDFMLNVVSNPKFVYSAINNFTPQDMMSLLENHGLKLKTERGNRVFPESDKSSDVNKTLEKALINSGVDIILNTKVLKILVEDNVVKGVLTNNGEIPCDTVIVCTGGVSYQTTGSDGDGLKWAETFGHEIIPVKPSLVGIELKGQDFIEAQGLSLKNVSLTAKFEDKTVFTEFGEMLFTHFGVSGPIVLSCSAKINRLDLNKIKLVIDLKPALDFDTLDKRLLREFKENNTKIISNVMRSLLPKALIKIVLYRAGVPLDKNCSEISALERQSIIKTLKYFEFCVKKLRPIDEAIVTAGGINVKQINPKTMESKLIKNLHFAGEVLDIDAFTGGFNLQLSFATGYAAGKNC